MYPHCFVPLIRKNTAIPTARSEVFYTAFDGQDKVDVSVYQGEAKDALENSAIGQFLMEGLSNVPAGNEIITTFSLDIDGILHVSSKEKKSGLEVTITIDNAIARFEGTQMEEAQVRISRLFGDEDELEDNAEQVKQRGHVQAEALIEKAERLMNVAAEADREDLVNLTESLKDAMLKDDIEGATDASAQLADLIFYLES
jgi:molecular chaperone DnaK (HSP70)